MPPIDLTLQGDEQESTSVLILVPVGRAELRSLSERLTTLRAPMRTAAPGLIAKRSPIEVLRGLRSPGLRLPLLNASGNVLSNPDVIVAESDWRTLLRGVDLLWYVRRRNAVAKAEVLGAIVRLTGDDMVAEEELVERLKTLGLQTRYQRLIARGSMIADAEVVALLSSPKLQQSRLLTEGAMREFEAHEKLDHGAALSVVTRFSQPALGEGIARLEKVSPEIAGSERVIKALATSGRLPEIDRLASAADEEELKVFADRLVEAGPEATAIVKLVDTVIAEGLRVIR